MITKLKFTEPEAKVYIVRISYIRHQYFVSFVFVMRASSYFLYVYTSIRLKA